MTVLVVIGSRRRSLSGDDGGDQPSRDSRGPGRGQHGTRSWTARIATGKAGGFGWSGREESHRRWRPECPVPARLRGRGQGAVGEARWVKTERVISAGSPVPVWGVRPCRPAILESSTAQDQRRHRTRLPRGRASPPSSDGARCAALDPARSVSRISGARPCRLQRWGQMVLDTGTRHPMVTFATRAVRSSTDRLRSCELATRSSASSDRPRSSRGRARHLLRGRTRRLAAGEPRSATQRRPTQADRRRGAPARRSPLCVRPRPPHPRQDDHPYWTGRIVGESGDEGSSGLA